MKKVITIFGIMLFSTLTLTSCSSNDKTNSSTSSENVLQNNIYIYVDDNTGYYFYDNDSCLYIYEGGGSYIYSEPKKYKISGNIVTIGDSSKYRILGSQALLSEEAFIDGSGRNPLLKSNDFAPYHKFR